MFVANRLLQACRITFFTRDNCGLCAQAKGVLSDVWDKRPFAYKEVNLALPESNPWRELYDFDIPVIHISKVNAGEEEVHAAGKAVKLMHRFTPGQVEAKMDQVENN
ncbi:glutaredoxin domain-containing protein [Metarhizium album ARSEF 1941]|uniref:Glutaredoxin-like protein n=1 Tax=Metarhizium album (strain ARSEF 1941) TaxID=1081103 RepID=A0A0B2WJJ9_METAS|nr:glutaredoxin domain-containing protein [Metarhizium album ARSEF 1941]KHN93864.1 glutaredoxin domain-containing protein [Metarhizium album ARSEF 1941]